MARDWQMIPLEAIRLDETIQCRSEMRQEAIDEYEALYRQAKRLPPVELYGTRKECWPGDGWHRIIAARKMGSLEIRANLHQGGRQEALQHALKANAQHGVRRTNADKRRAVGVALAEFPDKSSRHIAEMCGVSNRFVTNMRTETGVNNSHLTGQDGKTYPATKPQPSNKSSGQTSPANAPSEHAARNTNDEQEGDNRGKDASVEKNDHYTTGGRSDLDEEAKQRASDAMSFAQMAISQLERIQTDDPCRQEALQKVLFTIAEQFKMIQEGRSVFDQLIRYSLQHDVDHHFLDTLYCLKRLWMHTSKSNCDDFKQWIEKENCGYTRYNTCINQLERIRNNDPDLQEAMIKVIRYAEKRKNGKTGYRKTKRKAKGYAFDLADVATQQLDLIPDDDPWFDEALQEVIDYAEKRKQG